MASNFSNFWSAMNKTTQGDSPPDLYSPHVLSRILGIETEEIDRLSRTAPHYYKPFDLRKTASSNKWRHIDNPVGKLKSLQALLDRRILRLIPLPDTMYGGVPNRSTRMNALLHAKQPCVVTMDLKSCFPRISNHEVYRAFRRHMKVSREVASLLTRLLTLERRLPQGSPASPTIANITMIAMHEELAKVSRERGLILSQYVDDIIVSGEDAEESIGDLVAVVQKHGKDLSHSKLRIMGSGASQEVNGIVVNVTPRARRQFVDQTREMIAKLSLDHLPAASAIRKVQGRISYIAHLCPNQGATVRRFFDRRLDGVMSSETSSATRRERGLERDCKGYARHTRDE